MTKLITIAGSPTEDLAERAGLEFAQGLWSRPGPSLLHQVLRSCPVDAAWLLCQEPLVGARIVVQHEEAAHGRKVAVRLGSVAMLPHQRGQVDHFGLGWSGAAGARMPWSTLSQTLPSGFRTGLIVWLVSNARRLVVQGRGRNT